MKNQVIAIVGATGKTGSRVVNRLEMLGHPTRPLSRGSNQPFDWSDRSTWGPALEGCHAVYITYYPDLAIPQAEDDIGFFVEQAKVNGIRHLVLLSGRGEEGAQRAEQVVKDSGLDWNIVRASWFMQNFSESFMLDGLQAGELVLPEPRALEPFIDVDDIADVAVAALTNNKLRNQLFEITGPALLSFADCVNQIAAISKHDIGFTTLPVETYLSAARAEGLPEDVAWLIKELFVNVLDGRNAFVTNTVERVIGRPAKSFQDYAKNIAQTGDVWAAVGQQS